MLFIHLTLNAQNKPEDISSSFFKRLKKEIKDSAISELYNNLNPAIKANLQKTIKDQFQKIDSTDKFYDWLWITHTQMSQDLLLISYLLKYETKPYRLDIIFYKKQKEWHIQNVFIKDQLFPEF